MRPKRNLVARFAQRCGTGRHVSKQGNLAPRAKRKQHFIKEMRGYGREY